MALTPRWQVFEVFKKFFVDATANETKAEEDDMVVDNSKPARLRGCSVGSVDEALGGVAVAEVGMRAGKPLCLTRSSEGRGVMYPVRASTEGSFKLGMRTSSEPSVKALVDEFELRTTLQTFSSSGKAITAEHKELAFSSVVNAVNVSSFAFPSWSRAPVNRSDLGVVSRHAMPFRVMGLKLNPGNENLLLVWGVNTLHLKILNKSRNGVEKSINVCLEMESCESKAVVSVDWVPGSETQFVVSTTNCVKFYDLLAEYNINEMGELLPLVFFLISYGEGKHIKDHVVLAPPDEATMKHTRRSSAQMDEDDRNEDDDDDDDEFVVIEDGHRWDTTVIVMTSDGKLRAVPIIRMIERDYEDDGERFLETSECLEIPLGGVKVGTKVNSEASSTSTLGDGRELCYCPSSDSIAYSCKSSKSGEAAPPTLMLKFSNLTGKFSSSFEILPSRIPRATGGVGAYDIIGPFQHFVEVRREAKRRSAASTMALALSPF